MRILPEMCPRITCPFSSFTRKVALGRVSTISPCIWITSSFAIFATFSLPSETGILKRRIPLFPYPSPGRRESPAPEPPLFEQALVLVRHDVRLHLRHEVHGHDNDDQERGAAEVERHVPSQDQEFGQQANQGHVDGACHGQSQEDLLEILSRLIPRPATGNESTRFFQLVRRLLGIVLQRRVE